MHIATQHRLTNPQLSERAPELSVTGWLGRVYRQWRERQAELRELALMDERALRDARLTRWEVEQEMARPFWRG